MTDTFDALYEPDQVEVAEWEIERKRLSEIDVRRFRKMVDDFRDGTEPGRLIGQLARAYYDGQQHDDIKLRALRRARQPRITRNEIKPAINGLVGVVRQSKVDPKAYPRNPKNEEQADVASKTLRYIADKNRLHTIKTDCALDHFIEGAFGAVVELDERQEIVIAKVRYDEMIYDPRSREADFSDARYKGVGKWLYEQDIRAMYPDLAEDISGAFSSSWADFGLGQMYADKPDDLLGERWMDAKLRRFFVVEIHHREEDGWHRTVFFVGGVLENGLSPYLDEYKQPISNFVFQSCYVSAQNQRYGQAAGMLSNQDEVNSYASRALHLANSRQLQAVPGEIPEVAAKTASLEAAKADGVIPQGWGVVPTNDLFQGILLMLQDARQALQRQAPTPGVLAESGAGQSGRSKLVTQQAGMTEVALPYGRIEDWENGVYRMAWCVAKQFKTEPWWIRTSGDDGKPEFVGLNMPEPMQQDGAVVVGMDGQPVMQISNNLAEMDVDIEVETIPDTANLQAEQFEIIAPMLPLLAEAKGPEAAFKVGLALSSFPDKGRIKELVDAPPDDPAAQQAAQAQAQAAQQAQQIAQADAMAKISKTESDAALNEAKTRQVEADIVTKAMQAMPVDPGFQR